MDPELLAQILAAQSPQLSPLALAATQGGTSRTTLGQLTDPNILLGTGVADPSAIASGLRQYLTAESEAARRVAEQEFNQALETYLGEQRAIQSRLDAARERQPVLYSDVYSRYQNASPVVTNLFDSILSSSDPNRQPLSSAQVLERMGTELTAQDWVNSYGFDAATAQQLVDSGVDNINTYLADVEGLNPTQINDLKSGLRQFETDASRFRERQMEFADTFASDLAGAQEDLARLGPAPDVAEFGMPFDSERARLEYYKDIGLPGLALLPDPTVTYNVPVDAMLARARRDRPSGQTLAEELLVGTVRQPRTELGASGQMLTGRRPAPAPAVAGRGTATDVVAPLLGAVTPQGTRRQGGVPFTGASGRSAALQAALAPNTMTREQRIQQAAMRERENAQLEAQATARGLARAGRTPFEDAMRALYGYGVAEARA